MSFVVVIPARYSSVRLPGKALLDIGGKPMIQRVWERASQSGADAVVVATDDPRIEKSALGFGAQVMMTSSTHASGTDRLAEVVERMQLGEGRIVVNVQGDEPLIPPQVVDQVASNLAENEWSSVATLCEPIRDTEPLLDPAAVKVVFDKRGQACYFSRSCIPWPRNHQWSSGEMPPGCWYRHIGIYAYRAGFLTRFSRWQEAPTEHIESLEQLRALHQGERIHVAEASVPVPGGVDTEADLQSVRDQIKEQDS